MTLTATLQSLPECVLVSLNFSSATTPDLILKTFEQYCEYVKTPQGLVLRPSQVGKWLVVFCDEINLPAEDKYGTQIVITFLRQLTTRGGFWRSSGEWVRIERVQFVGACNPPILCSGTLETSSSSSKFRGTSHGEHRVVLLEKPKAVLSRDTTSLRLLSSRAIEVDSSTVRSDDLDRSYESRRFRASLGSRSFAPLS